MGNSLARRWRWLGYYHFARTRGRDTLDSIQPWVKIGIIGAPAAKYLGLSTEWAIVFGISIILGAEIAMVLLGAFDHTRGVIERQVALNNSQDPWKVETLDILRRLDRVANPALGTNGKQAVLIPLEMFNKPMPPDYAEAIRAAR